MTFMYMRNRTFFLLFFFAVGIIVLALGIGPVSLTHTIFWDIRLPRVILGFFVGMALAVAGVLMQSLLRNPLADPYLLGTSSGASIGVLAASMLRVHAAFGVQVLAFLFSLITMSVVYRLARTGTRVAIPTLMLAGVVVSTFLNALVFLAFSLFYRESFSSIFFLLGSLSQANLKTSLWVAGSVSVVVVAVGYLHRRLDLLTQGDEVAASLGLGVEKEKRLLYALASVLVAIAVTTSGMIGFIGLISPHLLRMRLGPRHAVLVPAAAIGGGILLVGMDIFAHTLAAPSEIPVGVVAAIFGTPFFLFLLKRHKGSIF